MKERIGILIPCRNVESTIGSSLLSLSADALSIIEEILCIDNLSSDKTIEEIRNFQSGTKSKLTLIKNSRDYNYGGSIKIGFRYFIERNFDWVIILHSDGQCEGNSILQNFATERSAYPNCDAILASRFKEDSDISDYSRSRTIGNLLFNSITRFATGLQISDSGGAISMIRTSLLKKIPYFQITNGLHFHPQLNILIYALKDTRIREIPLHWKDSDLPSSVRVFRYCLRLFKMLLGYRINLMLGKSGAHLFPFNDLNFTPAFQVLPPQNAPSV